MKPIETYKCEDCYKEWGEPFATFRAPSCPDCGEHLNVSETTKDFTPKEIKCKSCNGQLKLPNRLHFCSEICFSLYEKNKRKD